MSENKKYDVQVKEKKGTCNTDLFSKMATNGDLTSTKVSEVIGAVVTIVGFAKCTITTEEKTFDINYFDTKEYGLISSGSEYFTKSVETYYGEVEKVRITEIKTKKGTTYKAQPILKTNNETETKKEETTNNEDLPF